MATEEEEEEEEIQDGTYKASQIKDRIGSWSPSYSLLVTLHRSKKIT